MYKYVFNTLKVTDGKRVLKSLCCNNFNKFVFAQLSNNSIKSKLELLSEQVIGNVDILIVSETKIDKRFPIGNFLIRGFSPPYRLDPDSKGGRIMLYIREDIPSNFLATDNSINCFYNPHKTMIKDDLETLNNFLDFIPQNTRKC